MNTILLIDDEKAPMKYYIRALRQKNFDVKQCFKPEDAFQYLENSKSPPLVTILDIMMLPGEKYANEDTDDGLKTGLFVLRDLQKMYPTMPIIVLTNVNDSDTLNFIEEGPHIKVALKLVYPPFELVKLTIELISLSGPKKRLPTKSD